ncbi:hypothetical protein HDU93_003607, partial [Gonapodya sp. JEL0774]
MVFDFRKPVLRALEQSAHDLEGASMKLKETDEYFTAAIRALEERSIELPDESPLSKPEDANFPETARERHPESFRKYLYHKERVRDVEIAAKMVELATKNVEDKEIRFLGTVENLERATKPQPDQPATEMGSKVAQIAPSAEFASRALFTPVREGEASGFSAQLKEEHPDAFANYQTLRRMITVIEEEAAKAERLLDERIGSDPSREMAKSGSMGSDAEVVKWVQRSVHPVIFDKYVAWKWALTELESAVLTLNLATMDHNEKHRAVAIAAHNLRYGATEAESERHTDNTAAAPELPESTRNTHPAEFRTYVLFKLLMEDV